MGRKKVAALGGTAALGVVAGTVSFDGITINLAEVGPAVLLLVLLLGLVLFIVYGLFKGWIVPKPYYDSLQARATAAEAANERLSDRASKLTDTNAVQARTIEKNSAAADTTIKVMSALQDARTSAITGGSE